MNRLPIALLAAVCLLFALAVSTETTSARASSPLVKISFILDTRDPSGAPPGARTS